MNSQSREELQKYCEAGFISLSSTGSTATMGAGNRVGNHIEELKRPYGVGYGFSITFNKTKL